jgi:hypothetical protein
VGPAGQRIQDAHETQTERALHFGTQEIEEEKLKFDFYG